MNYSSGLLTPVVTPFSYIYNILDADKINTLKQMGPICYLRISV